ncbi:unnamed protein product [Aphanomyces euteiches]|nr:hypothetical protein AeRB84_008472 [Aphanomyces euteiches]
MVKVTLSCLVFGEETAFFVAIDSKKTVDRLKTMIKEVIDYDGSAHRLALYRAPNGLSKEEAKAVTFDEHGQLSGCIKMDELLQIQNVCHFGRRFRPVEGKIYVLVVIPEGQASDRTLHAPSVEFQDAVLCGIREIRTKVDAIEAKLPHKPRSDRTNGKLGEDELMRLRKEGLIIDFAPVPDEDPFWPQTEQQVVDAIDEEKVFDAFVTPYFNSALASYGMTFVNSEDYSWLPQEDIETTARYLKPDGFATHPGMFCVRKVQHDENGRVFQFGVAEKDLFDCLLLFESKLKISGAAFGQIARYLQTLSPNASACAIQIDRRSFWLIKSYKTVIFRVETANWIDGGSKALFENFIAANTSPWVKMLTNACPLLGVSIGSDAYLGRGAYGRVFKVTKDGEDFALKIVEESNFGVLCQEAEALRKAQDTGLTIQAVGNCVEVTGGAVLLLSPVGMPLPRPNSQSDVAKLFQLLWQLHSLDLVHGDPRVPNVIVHMDKPLWIALVEVNKANPS